MNNCASLDFAAINAAPNGFNFHQVESGQEIKEGQPIKASHDLKFDSMPTKADLDTI
jgi:hypothetical protein